MGVPQQPKDKKISVRKKKKKTGGYNHLSNGNAEKKKPATQLAKARKPATTTKKKPAAKATAKKKVYKRA